MSSKEKIFVIQKHKATHLHYDFRLEVNGKLKSWAVPKEPPKVSGEKRLAVHVEDHPLSYANFEGTIPEGNYGAGTVEIWDKGKYQNLKEISMEKAFQEGKIEIKLEGKKMKGNYALIRTKLGGKDKNWLLFKIK